MEAHPNAHRLQDFTVNIINATKSNLELCNSRENLNGVLYKNKHPYIMKNLTKIEDSHI